MAFSSSITDRTVMGNKVVLSGTYTQAATDSGGTITTGMGNINFFDTSPNGNVEETAPKITTSGGTVTIVTTVGSTGIWRAVGN